MYRFLALVLLLQACGGDRTPAPLVAGAGVALLPVPVGHSHAGYLQSEALGAPHPPNDPGSPFADLFPATRSLQSAPRAKALVLENGSGRIVLAQLDAIFVTATLTERVQELARKLLGADLEGRLLLHASHTHGAPGRFSPASIEPSMLASTPPPQRHALAHGIDTFSAESTDRIARGVVEAIGNALAARRPARFGWKAGVHETASRDRRCHDDWITGPGDRDTTLTVLRVDDADDGTPIAVLFHFALHGILYDHDSRALSVDAPGHVEYAVERRFDTPVVAIFLQGAAASASPAGNVLGHSGSQAMERVAEDLAGAILDLHRTIATDDAVPLRIHTRRARLSAAELGYARGEFPEDGAMLCHFLDSSCTGAARDPSRLDCLGRAVPGGGKYETWLAAAAVGDLAILSLPGEPSAAVGRALVEGARRRGFAHAIPLGYSLDHDGYILLADDWLSGGSETHITFWGWRYGAWAVERSLETLDRMLAFRASEPVRSPVRISWDEPPVPATDSDPAPGVAEEPLEVAERLTEIAFSFHGGDPALGTPEVRLQRAGGQGWEDVLHRGWIPVSNLRGPELPTFYEATPTHREAPEATSRHHLWRVLYEPPRDLPEGSYRLLARGRARIAGAVSAFTVASRPFHVVPSTALRVETTRVGDGLEATLLYPVRRAVYHSEPRDDGWQIGGFRPVDVRFPPERVPVLEGIAALPIRVDGEPVEAAFRETSFHAPLPPAATRIELPACALRDRWANCHPALLAPP